LIGGYQKGNKNSDELREEESPDRNALEPIIKSRSEQAIIRGFIDFIIDKEEYSSISRAKLHQLSLKELADEAKNITERINKEQEESEMVMQTKLTGMNHQVSEKISGFINTHIEMSKCK
jgi:hypothetical protein